MVDKTGDNAALEAIYAMVDAEREGHDFRETIYLIESPSADDLLDGRNEGDSLVRILKLAEISVVYFVAINEEMFEKAFDMIETAILNQPDVGTAMPMVHISAHGSEDGIELSDGDVILWDKLTTLLQKLHQTIGPINIPPPLPQCVPKVTLCLSSCSAFSAYKNAAPRPTPFQAIVGPIRDIGWCESMLAFASFYYTTNIMRKPYVSAVMCMNFANGSVIGDGPIFDTWNWFEDGDERP
nr:hypothetical protein [Brevundimonas diminuta]